MKINKLLLSAAIFASSLSLWSQSNNADVIRSNYPQVYNSITNNAQTQWSENTKLKNAVIEGQSLAFLDILKSSKSVNSNLLRDALLTSSLEGSKDSNARILNEMSLNEALPLLQCDWYKVQVYLRKKGDVATYQDPIIREKDEPATTQSVARVTETQPVVIETPTRAPEQSVYTAKRPITESENATRQTPVESTQLENRDVETKTQTVRRPTRIEDSPSTQRRSTTYPTQDRTTTRSQSSYSTPSQKSTQRRSQYDRYNSQRQLENEKYFAKENKDSQFKIGVKAAVGENIMYNLGNYTTTPLISYENTSILSNLQVKSVMGVTAEIGATFSYKTKGFLVQNETGLKYMQATFRNKRYTAADKYTEGASYSNKYFYLQTAFHFGGYFNVGEETQLIIAAGPYVAYQISGSYDKYGIFGNDKSIRSGLYEDYMKAGEKKVNFGVSAMIGLDINESRIALYPTFGLTKMQEKEEYKPFGVLVGYTYFF